MLDGMKWNIGLKWVKQFKVNDLNMYNKLTNLLYKSIDFYLCNSNFSKKNPDGSEVKLFLT